MKNLFSIKNFAAAVLACGVMFSFSSCEEDLCKDVVCSENGTLTESGSTCTCVCADGYEGTDCSTVSRSKFLTASGGSTTWDGSDVCTGITAPFEFTATITAASASEISILVGNFGGFGTAYTFTAPVDGLTFEVAGPVDFGGVDVTNIVGTINAAGTTINVTYTATDNSGSVTCNGTWTKL